MPASPALVGGAYATTFGGPSHRTGQVPNHQQHQLYQRSAGGFGKGGLAPAPAPASRARLRSAGEAEQPSRSGTSSMMRGAAAVAAAGGRSPGARPVAVSSGFGAARMSSVPQGAVSSPLARPMQLPAPRMGPPGVSGTTPRGSASGGAAGGLHPLQARPGFGSFGSTGGSSRGAGSATARSASSAGSFGGSMPRAGPSLGFGFGGSGGVPRGFGGRPPVVSGGAFGARPFPGPRPSASQGLSPPKGAKGD